MTDDRTALPAMPNEILVTGTINGKDLVLPALVDDDETWNGAAIPRFRREVTEYFIKWVNATVGESQESFVRARWDGTALVLTESKMEFDAFCDLRTVVAPDEDDRYCIGGRAWAWEFA